MCHGLNGVYVNMLRNRISTILPLFIILIFSSMMQVHSASTTLPCPPSTALVSSISKLPTEALGLSLLALIVSFDVIGIGYIVSKLLPTAGLRNWINAEILELAKSAFVIVGIFSILTFMSSIVYIVQGPPQIQGTGSTYQTNIGNTLYSAETYLCQVDGNVTNGTQSLAEFLLAEGNLQNLYITDQGFPLPPVPLPGPFDFIPVFRSSVGFPILANFFLGADIIYHAQFHSFIDDMLMFIQLPAIMIYSSQVILLPMLVSIGLILLIPAGLLMRALPFSRGVGGTLIALGIGISIIWPSTLVLVNNTLSQYMQNVLDAGAGTSYVASCNWGFWTFMCNFFNFIGGMVINAPPEYSGIAFSTIGSIYPALNFLLGYGVNGMYLAFQVFFLFVLDLIILFPLTDGIARLLGGTIRFQLGGKLKLV